MRISDWSSDVCSSDLTRRRVREYRRRMRGWLYRGAEAVAIEGIVEYKHFLYESLMDINVLMWRGHDRAEVAARAERELRSMRDYLAAKDEILYAHGNLLVARLVSGAGGADDRGGHRSGIGERWG